MQATPLSDCSASPLQCSPCYDLQGWLSARIQLLPYLPPEWHCESCDGGDQAGLGGVPVSGVAVDDADDDPPPGCSPMSSTPHHWPGHQRCCPHSHSESVQCGKWQHSPLAAGGPAGHPGCSLWCWPPHPGRLADSEIRGISTPALHHTLLITSMGIW